MNEEEFDSLRPWQPFGTEDARRAEAKAGRLTTLGIALWGRNDDELQQRLLKSIPDIPPGCDLDSLRELHDSLEKLAALSDKRYAWFSTFSGLQAVMKTLDARREIVRRAFRHLEGLGNPND